MLLDDLVEDILDEIKLFLPNRRDTPGMRWWRLEGQDQ